MKNHIIKNQNVIDWTVIKEDSVTKVLCKYIDSGDDIKKNSIMVSIVDVVFSYKVLKVEEDEIYYGENNEEYVIKNLIMEILEGESVDNIVFNV